MKSLLVSLLLLLSSAVHAEIRIAFFEYRDAQGNIIEFEPGGRFGHVAISYQDQWLHVHPMRGVEILPSFESLGPPAEMITLPRPALEAAEIEPLIGLPYDRTFNWDDPNSSYCSKLVGRLLGISPEPMDFSTPYWEGRGPLPQGEPGLSPDDIYREMTSIDQNLAQ